MNSLVKYLGYWGWSEHNKVYSNPPPLGFSFFLVLNQKIISRVNNFHLEANTIVQPSYQGPFHGKEGPKKLLGFGRGLYNLANYPVDREEQLGLLHITSLTPVLDVLPLKKALYLPFDF